MCDYHDVDSYIVIDDSLIKEEEEPKPSTSRVDLPPDEGVKNTINSAIIDCFNKNEKFFESQVKLFNDSINKNVEECLINNKALDELSSDLEVKLASIKNMYFKLRAVGINEPKKKNIEEELEEVIMSEEEINKFKEEAKTPKQAKRFEKKNDKDNIIVDRTVSVVPAHLPLIGPLEYPVVKSGQTVYAMKSTLIDPWYKGKIKSINEDYVHILFQTGKQSVKTKQIAYFTLNSVRFPVGCRVIAKFTDPSYQHVDAFYAGIVAELPKMLNKFR